MVYLYTYTSKIGRTIHPKYTQNKNKIRINYTLQLRTTRAVHYIRRHSGDHYRSDQLIEPLL